MGTKHKPGDDQPKPLTQEEQAELAEGRQIFGEAPKPVQIHEHELIQLPEPKASETAAKAEPKQEQPAQPEPEEKRSHIWRVLDSLNQEAAALRASPLFARVRARGEWAHLLALLLLYAAMATLYVAIVTVLLVAAFCVLLMRVLLWFLRRHPRERTTTVKVQTRGHSRRRHGHLHPFLLMHLLHGHHRHHQPQKPN